MPDRTFVGFGFGAIQAGLFLYEAFRSGNFNRLVVAEVMPDIVEAVRRNGGRYHVNIATKNGIMKQEVAGIEIFNPAMSDERDAIVEAVAYAGEICTALPSVKFYDSGRETDVASIISDGMRRKASSAKPRQAVIYTAENHNHAAEILHETLIRKSGGDGAAIGQYCQSLNTVIGKMSGVVTDKEQIARQGLAPVVPGMDRAFLVEEFNRILISRIRLRNFDRGIKVFEEKPDLLPFEEAKLYGHNATHALIGYLLLRKGRKLIANAREDDDVMKLARDAFIEESGKALCRKRSGVDVMFTEDGYRAYALDLLERMMNPYLNDTVERITRDPRRKLGWNDRLVGTMRMVHEQGIVPRRYATGAAAALSVLTSECGGTPGKLLDEIWSEDDHADADSRKTMKDLILGAE
jgi:mannitol-1-phosphate 5-dehydrogenase